MDSTLIGRYEILSELGRGGMAIVYLAFDPRFRRQVAIKVLPDRFLDRPVLRKRFEREAQSIAAIEHPAIVPVYDFGEQDEQLFLVMRYMPGGSLETRLRQGALPLPTTAAIITRLAGALDAVHAQGIVHRDLKPANILFDSYDNAYLSDFGIVHLTEASTVLTGEGLIGTPAYMSPEQVQGLGKIDPRSDLYSLGIIVFEMLTGQQPFRAATPMATAMQHLTQPVPALKPYQAGLPATVETLLQKALAKEPEARFQSAESLAAQLSGSALPGLLEDKTQVEADAKQPVAAVEKPTLVDGASLHEGSPTPTRLEADPATLVSASHRAGLQRDPGPQGVLPATPEKVSRPAKTYTPWIFGGLLGLLVLCAAAALVFFGLIYPRLRPQGAQLVLADSFSDTASGWPSGSFQNGAYGYDQEAYFISVTQPGDFFWATPARQAADVRVDVSATFANGSGEDYYGILCRLRDADNFYYFVITNSGNYTMGKYEEGNFTSFLGQGWVGSDAIRTGKSNNQLRADCNGDRLTFYINDERIQEVRDGTFAEGQYGLIASALGEDGVEIIFDDFKMYAP